MYLSVDVSALASIYTCACIYIYIYVLYVSSGRTPCENLKSISTCNMGCGREGSCFQPCLARPPAWARPPPSDRTAPVSSRLVRMSLCQHLSSTWQRNSRRSPVAKAKTFVITGNPECANLEVVRRSGRWMCVPGGC